MTLKLNGSSSGSVSIDAPASTTGGADITFNLPVADGSSGQALTTNASGQLAFATAGLFSSYAIICDSKSSGTDGGGGSTSTWNVRDLNTEIADPDGIVSISSNKFTLGAGSYLIKWSAPAHQVSRNQSRLYDVTNTAAISYSQSMRAHSSDTTSTNSLGFGRVTPSGSTEYRIEHNFESGGSAGNELGQGNSFSGSQIYTIVEIYKEA